jgi:signal transduction histidine kinase
MEAKTRAIASIAQAKIDLDRALAELDAIRTFDPTLIGAVAHALSNYITVTSATVEMLQLTLRDHPDEDIPNWLGGIEHATELMQHAVGRLVSASTPRDFPLKLEHVNLRVLMERACDYFRRRAQAKQVAINCRSIGRVPLVWGDRVAIAVVAENLLSNAVQASPNHGSIEVQIMTEPGYVVCSIRDPGPGLTKELQDRLLHRATATGTIASDSQTGLGVTVANEFVRRMDGDLWCESEPGRGARFSFRLPAIE